MAQSPRRKKQPNRSRRTTKPTTGFVPFTPKPVRPRGKGTYVPGVVDVPIEGIIHGLLSLTGEKLPILGLPVWYLAVSVGAPANHCLDAALTLQSAYRTYGIEAVPAPVELLAPDEAGQATAYGDPDPRFEDGYFVGHAGLWLPASRRFVDPTVQQFPGLRTANPWPVIFSASHDWPDLIDQPVGVTCAKTELVYRPLPLDALTAPVRELEALVDQGHHRAGVNLATNFLELLCSDPTLRAKVMAGPHDRLKALLGAVDGAEFEPDADRNLRIRLPGTGGGVYLDELI